MYDLIPGDILIPTNYYFKKYKRDRGWPNEYLINLCVYKNYDGENYWFKNSFNNNFTSTLEGFIYIKSTPLIELIYGTSHV